MLSLALSSVYILGVKNIYSNSYSGVNILCKYLMAQ